VGFACKFKKVSQLSQYRSHERLVGPYGGGAVADGEGWLGVASWEGFVAVEIEAGGLGFALRKCKRPVRCARVLVCCNGSDWRGGGGSW